MDISEKKFESDIEAFLLSSAGGYTKANPQDFDKQKGLFFDTLLQFIKTTQPKQWKRYEIVYASSNPEKEFYKRFNESVDKYGLIWVLRNEIEDRGVKFKVAYFAPTSSLNPELIESYNSNIFTCTRQFRYSPDNNNSIDMVLSFRYFNEIVATLHQYRNQRAHHNQKRR